MSELCLKLQEEMDEVLALGGTPEEFDQECQNHILECESCQAFCEESVALASLLDEPIPLPPADLTASVMQRITQSDLAEVELPRLPWAERFAWAASGAIAMFGLERIPEYSSSWFSGFEQIFLAGEWAFKVPMGVSVSTMMVTAFGLVVLQGALVYRTKGSVS